MCKWVWKCLFESLLSVLLGIYPEEELLNHTVFSIFNFLRNYRTIFHSGHPFHTPANTAQVQACSIVFPVPVHSSSILSVTLPEPPSNLHSPVSPLPPTQLEIKSLPSKTETNLATSYHFHPYHSSLWGPLKPESETKTWVQVVYLRDEPRREQGP